MVDKLELITVEQLNTMVYEIRGKQVMLDRDLAKIYGYEVKAFNQQVKRHAERFPEDFMFELTKSEMEDLSRSQFVTSIQTAGIKGGRTHNIKAFTEEGVYMLISVLKGEIATEQHIALVRAFKEMKDYIIQTQGIVTRNEHNLLTSQVMMNTEKIDNLANSVAQLSHNFLIGEHLKEWTFLQGDKFEANEAYIHIYSQAKQTIYLFDDYPSIKTLSLLSHKQEGVDVVLFTGNNASNAQKLRTLEVENFNTEYPTLKVKSNGIAHDRYIILDYGTENEKIYLCGTSSKDAGSKMSSIALLNDFPDFYSTIVEKLSQDDLVLPA